MKTACTCLLVSGQLAVAEDALHVEMHKCDSCLQQWRWPLLNYNQCSERHIEFKQGIMT